MEVLDQWGEALRIELHEGGVAELVFGPPGTLPTYDAAQHGALARLWQRLATHARVRCILVRSEGKGFCAGGGFDLVQELIDTEAARLRVLREARDLVQGMLDCDVPIVSAIHGGVAGAGAAVALLADVSIAAHDAKIVDGHTRLGVAAGDHAVIIWPLLCGMAKAKYYLLTCAALSGEEAERIGLVSLSVPATELLERARSVARSLAAGSPRALGATKRSLNHWLRAAWPAFEHSLSAEILGFTGDDAREGLASLRERRDPRFANDPG